MCWRRSSTRTPGSWAASCSTPWRPFPTTTTATAGSCASRRCWGSCPQLACQPLEGGRVHPVQHAQDELPGDAHLRRDQMSARVGGRVVDGVIPPFDPGGGDAGQLERLVVAPAGPARVAHCLLYTS